MLILQIVPEMISSFFSIFKSYINASLINISFNFFIMLTLKDRNLSDKV